MNVAAIPVSAFSDNYIWLCPLQESPARVIVIDPGAAEPVLACCEENALQPAAILVTHHHSDHVGGIEGILQAFQVPVYGPRPSIARFYADAHRLEEGDTIEIEGDQFDVMAVAGHTMDHIAYYGNGRLFCGDTLFSVGCGRLFEGSPEQMYTSLQRIAALPGDTLVHCAHEYTLSNLRFACAVEADNPTLQDHRRRCELMRAANQPTVPSTLSLEKQINPFLRCHKTDVITAAEAYAQETLASPVEVFTVLRRWKDNFS